MSNGELCAEKPLAAELLSARQNPPQNGASTNGQPPAVELRWTVYGPTSSPDGFEALESEWNALLQRSRFNTIFLSYEWQTTWWRYLGEGDLWIVAFRHPCSGELVGIVPLYLVINRDGPWAGKRKLNLVGCIEVSDYLDIIAAKGWEEAVLRSLSAWLCSNEAPAWDVLDLCNLPQDSRTYHLASVFEEHNFRTRVTREDVAPQFELPARYETYLQELVDKKQRHEIRRKQRRAEREHQIDFYIVGPEANLGAEMEDFARLQRASREDKAEFMTPEMRRFFGAMAKRMAEAGYLRLCFLSIDGHKAAALLAFEYNRRFLLYNSGYDPDAFAHLSPGWVLLAYTIQYSIAVGCQVYDFMQGNEEYKYRFGSHDYDVMRLIVERAE